VPAGIVKVSPSETILISVIFMTDCPNKLLATIANMKNSILFRFKFFMI
jgi:hypothetical protein